MTSEELDARWPLSRGRRLIAAVHCYHERRPYKAFPFTHFDLWTYVDARRVAFVEFLSWQFNVRDHND